MRVIHRTFLCLECSEYLYDLLPKQDVFCCQDTVVMVMAQEPTFEVQLLVDQLQKICEGVRLVVAVHSPRDTGGSTVSDHIVRFPSSPLQSFQSFHIFRIGGQLLRPLGTAQNAEPLAALITQPLERLLEIRCFRVQDTVLDIVALCAAHGEEGVSLDAVQLPPHQVDHMRPNEVDLAAVPFVDWELVQPCKILMVSICPEDGKRFFLWKFP